MLPHGVAGNIVPLWSLMSIPNDDFISGQSGTLETDLFGRVKALFDLVCTGFSVGAVSQEVKPRASQHICRHAACFHQVCCYFERSVFSGAMSRCDSTTTAVSFVYIYTSYIYQLRLVSYRYFFTKFWDCPWVPAPPSPTRLT